MCEDSKIRVNKITVNVNKRFDETKISLYKTNEFLGTLDDIDIIPQFSTSGVSLKAYQEYCRDFVIEMLNNDVIPGYYYEPKSENQSVKYDTSEFKKGVLGYIESILGDKYEYQVLLTEEIDIIDRYSDGCIKNATGEFDVKLLQFDIIITIISDIKSGHLCRPRIFRYDDMEYSFNITNVGRIIRSIS